jgi:hypothetical protein
VKQRFVIVHYDQASDYYTLIQANQGRHHYDDKDEALKAAEVLRPGLKEKLGWDQVKVVTALCYDHGDCCRTIFTPEYVEQYEAKP